MALHSASPVIRSVGATPPARRHQRNRFAIGMHSSPSKAGSMAAQCSVMRNARLSRSVNVMIAVTGGAVSREEVLAKLRERIVVFAASHLSRDAAEDLAQEVLMLLHEKYAHLDRAEDLLPLSLRIVRFKLMSLRRKAVRRGEYSQVSIEDIPLPDLDSSPADYVERKEMLERLSRAMGQLGERCRELMRLKLQGKTFPEIQKIMGAGAINT